MPIRWSAVRVSEAVDEIEELTKSMGATLWQIREKAQELRRIPDLPGYIDQPTASMTSKVDNFNTDFRFNSQSTAMQFTSKKTIGGRAWPSIKLANAEQEKALVLWANSSLGLLLHWWYANKQQAGRGSIGILALESLLVLDVTKLSKQALAKAVAIFDEMKHKELRPVNEIAKDTMRAEIDTRLATEVLGFSPELVAPDGPLALLRQKLALEPSITGSKSLS